MFTVSVDRTEESRATALGALGYLRKPITADALIDAVIAIGLHVDGDRHGRIITE